MPTGVYPGSFNPPTIAHLAIATAARQQLGLDRVDLAISRVALGKEHLDDDSIEQRTTALRQLGDGRDWLGIIVVDTRLIADIAQGYDAVIMGADKWVQVNDPSWYGGNEAERDAAVAALPRIAVAPRHGIDVPPELLLDVPQHLADISSTAVRGGRSEWAAGGPSTS